MKNFYQILLNKLKTGTSPMCTCSWELKKLQSLADFQQPICYKLHSNNYLFLESVDQINFLKTSLEVVENYPVHILEGMMNDKYLDEFEVILLEIWE